MNNSNRRDTLISFRKGKAWSQKDVVEKLASEFNVSISDSYYGMIEQGVRTPSLNIALSIASLYDVEPNKIFLTNNPTFCCENSQQKQLA